MDRRKFIGNGITGCLGALVAPMAFGAESSTEAIEATEKHKAWKNKVVLVVGSTSGIGKVAATTFAQWGSKVIITGRRTDKGEAAVKAVKSKGGEAFFVKADVRSEKDVSSMVKKAVEKYGRLDLCINCAGIEYESVNLHDDDIEKHIDVINTNLVGMMYCMKHELAVMLKQGGGSIVNIASVASTKSNPVSSYTASKHGVLGLTRSTAAVYVKNNIRINAVSPGDVNHHMDGTDNRIDLGSEKGKMMLKRVPTNRLVEMQEVVEYISWVASGDAPSVVGQNLVIDGGRHL